MINKKSQLEQDFWKNGKLSCPIQPGFMERTCEKAGSDRLLFGSDMPWFATSHSIGCVLSADLTDDDRENIFWRNGDKLLQRFDWYTPGAK